MFDYSPGVFQIFCNGFTHVQTTPGQVLKALEFRIKILFFFGKVSYEKM